MPPTAVLFDFDGVIADTENIHVAAWERTFGSMGWDVPPEDCARAAEVDDRAFLTGLLAVRGIEGGDVEGWVRRKQATTLAMLADSPRIYPGVRELVGHLRGRARLAVVSTTWRANIAAVLGPANLAGAFELIIAKEDVRALKPEPDAYLLALKRLALPAGGVVAVEDSAAGLTAARAAGLRCLAVGHRRPAGDWAADAGFVAGLDDLPAVLKALGFPPTTGERGTSAP